MEWVSGFGTACGADGFMEGIHADFLPLTGAATFGRDGLIGGFQTDGRRSRSSSADSSAPAEASGTPAPAGGPRLRHEGRRWRAVTG